MKKRRSTSEKKITQKVNNYCYRRITLVTTVKTCKHYSVAITVHAVCTKARGWLAYRWRVDSRTATATTATWPRLRDGIWAKPMK